MKRATYELFHDEGAHELARFLETFLVLAASILVLYGVLYTGVF